MAAYSTLLKAVGLSVGYRRPFLFDGLDLQLRSGELVCFMGSNGVGKTTLLKTLAGLRKPQAGKVMADTKAAVVLTDRIHTYHMTVRDLVTFGRYPYLSWNLNLTEDDRQIIEQSLTRVHLHPIADKNINEISDGQLQMALIGRALAQTSPLLLLDEPTAHLDLNNRLEIMTLLKQLARESQKAILVATHELDLALQTADRIWLAAPDKNILTGIPEDLVLDGSFDTVFKFKGYDLKTGKIQHTTHHDKVVQLQGEGHIYLWTKNALERNGYQVTESNGLVILLHEDGSSRWEFNGRQFDRIEYLLEAIR